MRKGFPYLAGLFLAAILHGCTTSAGPPTGPSQSPPPPPPIPGADPARGRAAFEQECAVCHTTVDGFDIAYFGYADTTIVRRAVKHVSTATAWDIVAYIRTLNTPVVSRGLRLFQPGGGLVADDAAFALALFGQDGLPPFTSAQMSSLDPLKVKVSFELPVWSDEGSNKDWLPDDPLPAEILNYGSASSELAGYRSAPSTSNLLKAVAALHAADHAAGNSAAPCVFSDPARLDYDECFETRRWISVLIAQHMLRNGQRGSLGGKHAEVWWDVGDAARRAVSVAGQPIPNPRLNGITWMYLGWLVDPGRHETFYLGNALAGIGLKRQATWVSLRSQVARPSGSWTEHRSVYHDLVDAVGHAPPSWTEAVARFCLTHALERLNAGDGPRNAQEATMAANLLDAAMTRAATKVSGSVLSSLQALADQVKSRL